MAETASDDFAGDGALSANWTMIGNYDSLPVREGGAAVPGGGSHGDNSAAYWSATAWPADHYSEITVGLISTGEVAAIVRAASGQSYNRDYYAISATATASSIAKYILNSYSELGTAGPGVSNGDVLRCWIIGSQIWVSINGTPVCGSPVTDTDLTTGYPGFQISGNTPTTILSWSGGTPSAAFLLQNLERGRAIERGFMRGMAKVASGLLLPINLARKGV